jgi:hypothetical protein
MVGRMNRFWIIWSGFPLMVFGCWIVWIMTPHYTVIKEDPFYEWTGEVLPFDSAAWKTESRERYRMIEPLCGAESFSKMSRSQLWELLGAPNYAPFAGFRSIDGWPLSFPGCGNAQTSYLEIDFFGEFAVQYRRVLVDPGINHLDGLDVRREFPWHKVKPRKLDIDDLPILRNLKHLIAP